MGRSHLLVALGLCLIAGMVGSTTLAALSGQTTNQSNSFSANSDFPAMEIASGSYLGDGTDNRSVTGLPFQPDVVIVKASTNQIGVMRTSRRYCAAPVSST